MQQEVMWVMSSRSTSHHRLHLGFISYGTCVDKKCLWLLMAPGTTISRAIRCARTHNLIRVNWSNVQLIGPLNSLLSLLPRLFHWKGEWLQWKATALYEIAALCPAPPAPDIVVFAQFCPLSDTESESLPVSLVGFCFKNSEASPIPSLPFAPQHSFASALISEKDTRDKTRDIKCECDICGIQKKTCCEVKIRRSFEFLSVPFAPPSPLLQLSQVTEENAHHQKAPLEDKSRNWGIPPPLP